MKKLRAHPLNNEFWDNTNPTDVSIHTVNSEEKMMGSHITKLHTHKDAQPVIADLTISPPSNADNAPPRRNNKNNVMRLQRFIGHPNGIVFRVFKRKQSGIQKNEPITDIKIRTETDQQRAGVKNLNPCTHFFEKSIVKFTVHHHMVFLFVLVTGT